MNSSHCGIFSEDMVKTINTKVLQRIKRAFSRLMKQMALEPINSFPREYSCGIGAWCVMGFVLEQKACLDADARSCSNLCFGTVLQLGWDQGISKVTFAPPVLSCSLLFLSCITDHTGGWDWSSNLLYYFSLHTNKQKTFCIFYRFTLLK